MEILLVFLGYFLGLTLLISEVFLPGAIMGLTGSVIMVYCIYRSFEINMLIGLVQLAVTLAVVPASVVIALKKMRQKEVILGQLEESAGLRALVGKICDVYTDLKPSGFIELNGERFAARAIVGYIEKGVKVKVVDVDGKTLIVEMQKKSVQ